MSGISTRTLCPTRDPSNTCQRSKSGPNKAMCPDLGNIAEPGRAGPLGARLMSHLRPEISFWMFLGGHSSPLAHPSSLQTAQTNRIQSTPAPLIRWPLAYGVPAQDSRTSFKRRCSRRSGSHPASGSRSRPSDSGCSIVHTFRVRSHSPETEKHSCLSTT